MGASDGRATGRLSRAPLLIQPSRPPAPAASQVRRRVGRQRASQERGIWRASPPPGRPSHQSVSSMSAAGAAAAVVLYLTHPIHAAAANAASAAAAADPVPGVRASSPRPSRVSVAVRRPTVRDRSVYNTRRRAVEASANESWSNACRSTRRELGKARRRAGRSSPAADAVQKQAPENVFVLVDVRSARATDRPTSPLLASQLPGVLVGSSSPKQMPTRANDDETSPVSIWHRSSGSSRSSRN